MKIYLVGGAVRDKLLDLPVKEKDYVVVGGTVQAMERLGFRQVGKEFPVFIHPKTGEEYALARAERKVKPGYQGFVFDTSETVTLEDDLRRRDLTINAMAYDEETDTLIDPFQGLTDLKNHRVLRHVSEAFAEDPVRILRIGRFLSRFAHLGFKVHPSTLQLMKNMVEAGEVNALVAERVWKELERALQEKNPELFFILLGECHALDILFPSVTLQGKGMVALQYAASLSKDPLIRFAALLHDDDYQMDTRKKMISALCHRYRVPTRYKDLATLTATHYQTGLIAKQLSAEKLLHLLNQLDVFRRETRFQNFLLALRAIARAHQTEFDALFLLQCAEAAKTVDVKNLLAAGLNGIELAAALAKERLIRIEYFLSQYK